MKSVKIGAACFAAVVVIGVMSGCGTYQANRDTAKCMNMGFEPGTPHFLECRMHLEQARDQRGLAFRKALGTLFQGYGAAIRPKSTTCLSSHGDGYGSVTCY